MLGIYDYTVVLTYVSLMVSIGGMMLSVNGHLNLAVLCLAIRDCVICLTGRSHGRKRIVPKKKNALESRLIRCVISSVSG